MIILYAGNKTKSKQNNERKIVSIYKHLLKDIYLKITKIKQIRIIIM